MASALVKATLAFAILATLAGLVTLILLGVDMSQRRSTCPTGTTTGTTGTTGGTGSTGTMESFGTLGSAFGSSSSSLSSWAVNEFGDGSAGDAQFVGQTGLVLMADAHYRDLTVESSRIALNGYALYVSGTLRLADVDLHHRGLPGAPGVVASAAAVVATGGAGAPSGTLGGGGRGGSGRPDTGGLVGDEDGEDVGRALLGWESSSAFAGADAARASDAGAAGRCGLVLGDPLIAHTDALRALRMVPSAPRSALDAPGAPLLSGGSGGGGGRGRAGRVGSGGGGGGGVAVIAARRLVVEKQSRSNPHAGATIDVSGGDAGPVPTGAGQDERGGGGGGGLVLLHTESPPESYAGLRFVVHGGAGPGPGPHQRASPGRVVDWTNTTHRHGDVVGGAAGAAHVAAAHPGPPQSVPSNLPTTVLFANVNPRSRPNGALFFHPVTGTLTALRSGLYDVAVNVAVPSSISIAGWFRVNRTTDPAKQLWRREVTAAPGGAFVDSLHHLELRATLVLDAGDTLDVQLLQNTGAPVLAGPALFSASLRAPLT